MLTDPTELFPEISNIYDFPSVHVSMLYDNERLEKYKTAINRIVKPGDVVADIGTGTGLLAFLCLKAGAKKVHAIERTSAIEWAKKIAHKNGLSDKIEFHNADSLDCDLGEKVDVIISELIGHIASDALITYTLANKENKNVHSVNSVVGETNDGWLNDIRGRHIREEHILDAIKNAKTGPVKEENVGAGTGTRCFQYRNGFTHHPKAFRRLYGGCFSSDKFWWCF